MTEDGQATGFDAPAYGPAWRVVRGTLVALAGASLWAILLLVLGANDPPVTPPVLLRLVALFTLPPALAALAIRRVLTARVTLDPGALGIARGDLRLSVPHEVIAGVSPWRLPLPDGGLSFRLRSGRRLDLGLEVRNSSEILAALAAHGVAAAGRAAQHPAVAWAAARRPAPRWYHRGAKFGLFALPPIALLFNLHQQIAYGGFFGEWYLLGARAWCRTLAVYGLAIVVYLVLWASLWRGLGEIVGFAATAAAPERAPGIRRVVEIVCAVAYYGGVPLLLAVRFLP